MTNSRYKNILILGAMECEIALFKNRTDLHIIKTGVGERSVNKCIQKKIIPILKNHKIDCAINVGFAGSLARDVKKLTLILPNKITHQATKKSISIDSALWLPFVEKISPLQSKKYNIGGHLLCADQILNREDKKKLSAMDEKYTYVDMESYWIGQFMQERGIPFVVIRCILDDYNFQFPPLKFLRAQWPLALWKEALVHFLFHPVELINLHLLRIYEKKAACENSMAVSLFLESMT
ncbi:MAG: hypothetical protein ACMUIP_09585 [bacterium]